MITVKIEIQIFAAIVVIILLSFGFLLVNTYKAIRNPDTTCSISADCEDLVHPECVGEWICTNNLCAWLCELDNATPQEQQGGLGGSTVECIEDSNCQKGVCPDGYEYQQYACMSNKCVELQFFADPCLNHR